MRVISKVINKFGDIVSTLVDDQLSLEQQTNNKNLGQDTNIILELSEENEQLK